MYRLSIAAVLSALIYYATNAISITLGIGICFYICIGGHKWIYLLFKTLPRDIKYVIKGIKIALKMKSFAKEGKTVADIFSDTTKENPSKAAIISADTGEIMSFQDVENLINKISNSFHSLGYNSADVVAIYMGNELEYFPLMMGLLKRGIVTALINNNLTGSMLKHCIEAGKCKAIIFHADLRDNIMDIRNSLPGKIQYIVIGANIDEGNVTSFSTMMAIASTECCEKLENANLNSLASYVYTSGTTGLPKAAIMPATKAVLGTVLFNELTNVSTEDVIYNVLPMYHTSGSLIFTAQMILKGCTMVLRKKFSASRYADDCRKYGVTYSCYIGEICRYLLNQPHNPLDQSLNIRTMVGNGLRKSLFSAMRNRFGVKNIYEFYAATEGNVLFINNGNVDGAVGYMLVSLWFLNYAKLIKVDTETGKILRNKKGFGIECYPGEPGQVVCPIGKIHPFSGYTDKDASKKKVAFDVFCAGDSVFLSGDILVKDELGYLYFCDRLGDTFRWKGENVSTTEVENTISKVLNCTDVVVYPVSVPGTEGKGGMAYMNINQGDFDAQFVTQQLKESLPKYAIPLFIRVGNCVSVTGTHKYQKSKLKKESFDPKCLDKEEELYFYSSNKYEKLGLVRYEEIKNGQHNF